MKKILLLSLLSLCLKYGQAQQAAYTFPLPKGWASEKINFPIDFAPKIPFTGIEELRFTPGWGKSTTNQYWAYAFLWFVDGDQKLKKDDLESYLTQYFDGLYLSNLKNKTGAPANFTQAKVKKMKAQVNDQQTFEAGINTLDFLSGKTISFYARVHVRNYKTGHTAVLFEISPQDYKNVVWDELDGVVNGFSPPTH